MKILQIISTLGIGGAERLVVDLSYQFKQNKNIEQEVYVLKRTNSFFEEKIESENIPISYSSRKSLYSLFHIVDIYRKVKDFDIIQVHLFHAIYFVGLLKLCFRFAGKIILTEHNTNNRRRKYFIFKIFERFIYTKYRKIICITNETEKNLINWIPSIKNKTVVINNGINNKIFELSDNLDLRKMYSLKPTDRLLLCVGGFRHQKNQELLVRSMKLLSDNYKLFFIGSGALEKFNKNLTEELLLTERIFFLGMQSNVERYYKSCDLFVLPSKWEGFGLVAAEAMAAGLSVLVSDVPGLSNVVGNAGLKFESENVKDLVEKINYIFENSKEKNARIQTGLIRVNDFSIEKMANKYLDVYKQLKS